MTDKRIKMFAYGAAIYAALLVGAGYGLGLYRGHTLKEEDIEKRLECYSLASGFMTQGAWEPLHFADKHTPGRKQLELGLACFWIDADGLPTREKPMVIRQWWRKL